MTNENSREVNFEDSREVHTYADGSQRVGSAPFPKESPLEASGGDGTPAAKPGMRIPDGIKTSGAAAPAEGTNVTTKEFKARVEQQLAADIASGKNPNTPNPTTASDKPELAGVAAVVNGKDPSNPADLKSLASGVKVKGGDKDMLDAAATQVARETGGLVVDSNKAKK